MDSKAALDKIKQAEFKAQSIQEEAKREAKRILNFAKQEKERLVQRNKEKALLDNKNLRTQIHQEALKEVSAIEGQSKAEVEQIKEKAGHNLDKAVEFIKDKINF